MCPTCLRSELVCRSGRISSMLAPVVPIRLASSAPTARKPVLIGRRRPQVAPQHDPSRDREERAEQHDERHVLEPRMPEQLRLVRRNVERDRHTEHGAHDPLVGVPLPEVRPAERDDRDPEQHQRERSDRPERQGVPQRRRVTLVHGRGLYAVKPPLRKVAACRPLKRRVRWWDSTSERARATSGPSGQRAFGAERRSARADLRPNRGGTS